MTWKYFIEHHVGDPPDPSVPRTALCERCLAQKRSTHWVGSSEEIGCWICEDCEYWLDQEERAE
jgi:hypothetical protein